VRVVALDRELLEALDPKARVGEGCEEVVQREVHRTDADAHALRVPDAEGAPVVATGAPVAEGKLGHALRLDEERVGPDEARVAAQVDERPPGLQHPGDLGHGLREPVDVRVRPERGGRVEARVLEGQRVRRRFDDLEAAAPGPLEQVAREVDPDGRPAELGDRQRGHAGPAADVEAAAVARAEQPAERLELVAGELAPEPLVPLGEPVVARLGHAVDASPAARGRSWCRPRPARTRARG
jgi:hypothetical protein